MDHRCLALGLYGTGCQWDWGRYDLYCIDGLSPTFHADISGALARPTDVAPRPMVPCKACNFISHIFSQLRFCMRAPVLLCIMVAPTALCLRETSYKNDTKSPQGTISRNHRSCRLPTTISTTYNLLILICFFVPREHLVLHETTAYQACQAPINHERRTCPRSHPNLLRYTRGNHCRCPASPTMASKMYETFYYCFFVCQTLSRVYRTVTTMIEYKEVGVELPPNISGVSNTTHCSWKTLRLNLLRVVHRLFESPGFMDMEYWLLCHDVL